MKTKVLIAISGGVDSSVSAYLLKKQGYDLQAVFMKNWDEDDGGEYCTAKKDYADAQNVCNQLDIPLQFVNFASEYWQDVFTDFLAGIKAGYTPNPDILCNRYIKFGYLVKFAQKLGMDYLATGHYAKLIHTKTQPQLHQAKDKNKDQTYFLYAVKKQSLMQVLFPLADLDKQQVRQIADQIGLINAKKKDSTGICFIGERNFRDFLSRYLANKKGKIINWHSGEVVGEHLGIEKYTIGQRKGMGVGGISGQNDQPWYIAGKSLKKNELYIVQGKNHPKLFAQKLRAKNLNWLSAVKTNTIYQAKIRYRQQGQNCQITSLTDKWAQISFVEAQRAITVGQSVVLYDGSLCLGGGIIDSVDN